MSVYRELAAELRANKAVIDSLNSRNEQLLKQNQRLRQEIHHVVQAALTLGQAAGVARPAKEGLHSSSPRNSSSSHGSVPGGAQEDLSDQSSADTLASLVRSKGEKKAERQKNAGDSNLDAPADEIPTVYEPLIMPVQNALAKATRNRVPKPIGEGQSAERPGKRQGLRSTKSASYQSQTSTQTGTQSGLQFSAVLPKLFTEQSGNHRSSILEKDSEKEIGGIWLALSIILIIMTAFGAGFLIMKPLLNER